MNQNRRGPRLRRRGDTSRRPKRVRRGILRRSANQNTRQQPSENGKIDFQRRRDPNRRNHESAEHQHAQTRGNRSVAHRRQ